MKKTWLLILMLLPGMAWAGDLKLDGAHSDISFVSVKKGSVGEVHHFTSLNGSVDGGSASVTIDLASVQSGIDVRNERMRGMLFEVAKYATATITADITALQVEALKPGQHLSALLPLMLDLHGVKRELKAEVSVVALEDGALLVSSRSPVVIKAADFGLDGGIEALREVAKLPAIATAVPVSFELNFVR